MGRIIIATIARDEASRYLRSALAAWSAFADLIIAIDNDSTDATRDLLFDAGATLVDAPSEKPMWDDEAPFRRRLFECAVTAATDDDVILWLDADMTPLRDPRSVFVDGGDVYLFNLYDLWSADEYRMEPSYWIASVAWRPWALSAKFARKLDPAALERDIHCGHLPPFDPLTAETVYMPPSFGLLHYGYRSEQDRAERSDRYLGIAARLSPQELAHAQTILDADPLLTKLPYAPAWPLERGS